MAALLRSISGDKVVQWKWNKCTDSISCLIRLTHLVLFVPPSLTNTPHMRWGCCLFVDLWELLSAGGQLTSGLLVLIEVVSFFMDVFVFRTKMHLCYASYVTCAAKHCSFFFFFTYMLAKEYLTKVTHHSSQSWVFIGSKRNYYRQHRWGKWRTASKQSKQITISVLL